MQRTHLFVLILLISSTSFGDAGSIFNQNAVNEERVYVERDILRNNQRTMPEVSPAYNSQDYNAVFGQTLDPNLVQQQAEATPQKVFLPEPEIYEDDMPQFEDTSAPAPTNDMPNFNAPYPGIPLEEEYEEIPVEDEFIESEEYGDYEELPAEEY